MKAVPSPRALLKKGAKSALPKKKASGFDYPTRVVGTTTWTGEDGKPVTVYYDPSLGSEGLKVAQYVLAKLEDVMASCDLWFGVRGDSGNVIVAPDFGGAYHYGCSFDEGGDWYLSLSDQDTTVGLAVAEITESYMGKQAKGWDCGGSGGEALSRVLAEVATGGADGAMRDYAAGPAWDGSNWIDRDSGTDQDYPSTGCGVLYLWAMLAGYKVETIVQAGERGGVLAGNYATLTGEPKSNAWPWFSKLIESMGGPGSFSSDNPFQTPNPTYPAGGSPPPPPPPPPGEPGTFTGDGVLHLGGALFPLEVKGVFASAPASQPSASPWSVLGDLASIISDFRRGDMNAVATDVEKLLADLGIVMTPKDRAAYVQACAAKLGLQLVRFTGDNKASS